MKHSRVTALLLVCLALMSVGFLAAMSDFSDLPPIDLYEVRDDAMIPGHVWIRLNPGLVNHLDRLEHRDGVLSSFEIPELDELNSHYQVSKINLLYHITMQNTKFNWRHREWGLNLWYEIHFDSKEDIRDIVMAYRELKGLVEWAEPEYRKVLYGVHDNLNDHAAPEAPGEESERWTPNDPYFSSQWHYHNTGQNGGTTNCDIDLPEAWDIEKGHSDVIVAVIDDGVQYNHPDLDNNMWSGRGYNFVTGSTTINPGDHGTHVAGTIAAENNNSTGVCGIAGGNGSTKGVSIMSCQVFSGSSQGGFSNAPTWAADNGAAISQNSWGYSYPNQYSQAELTAINYFNTNGGGTVMNGGITIFAAGNEEAEGNYYPGCYSGSFSVAGTNYKDEKSWYSNWGTWVDISAPGGETFYTNDPKGVRSTITGNSYAYYQGTSMACPHTSGVAALVISRAHRLGMSITPTDVKNILRNTTDDHYAQNSSYVGKLGTGRLNAYQALLAVAPPLNPPRNLVAESSHRSVSLSWDAPEDTTPTNYVVYRNNSQIGTTSNLYYLDSNLTNGTTYSYYVKARYSQGDSEASNTVTATPNSFPPTNLVAVGGDSVVFLNWNSAQGRGEDEEDDIRAMTGYRIYRNGSALTTTTGTSYADNAVTNGVTYSYYVKTVYSNPTGESAASNTAQATPIALNYGIIASGMTATGGQDGCPINVYKKSLHGQSVYTAQELLSSGFFPTAEILQIGFYVDSAPNVPLPNFMVRMGHTTASNASNWIPESNLMTVYQTASYQPTAGGWDMLILSVPFEWNGVDNIVVDTAFDMVSEESTTGTVLYIDTPSGYRFGRTSTSNMAGTFSGGVVSRNKPALRMGFVGEPPVGPSGPMISVDPGELNFGAVLVGQSSVKQFTIANEGDEELSGSITTPTGYSVSWSGREEQGLSSSRGAQERNSLYFNITPGDQRVYNLSFSPTAAGNYNGEVEIISNDENNSEFLVTVTGTGVTPPSISLSTNSLSAPTTNGNPLTRRFTITNSGSQNLTFNLVESPELAWFSASPVSGTIAGGGSQQITGTFAPEGITPGTHTGNLLVNSNDPVNPQLTVSLNLTVHNTAPSISLPESYEFDVYADQNLIVDFSPYISDPDNQTLTLTSSGNNNIQVDINGHAVTFSSPNGWTGTEQITFKVYDGYTQASDAVDVTVTKIMNAPTALNGLGGDRRVDIFWTAPSSLAGVSGYRVYRDGMFLTETSDTSYIDDTVSNNIEYSYYVTSIYSNPTGESEASNTIFVTPSAIITVILGSGNSNTSNNTACPINTYRRSLHGQSVYTKAELNAAGVYGPSDISALGFYVNTVSPRALPSFIVRMKHTTDSNVSSWQSASGMVTVYNNSSYTPTAGGFDMLTLDTPFTWNGEDNIVIDTAFGLISSTSNSGTVRYTSVTNGYRYVQASSWSASDQTNVFSGGSTSTYRPNVQLTFTGVPDLPPVITVNPQQLDFGEVLAGGSKVMQFTIANDGEEELSGSMNTPTGYSVALSGRTVQDSGLRSKNSSETRNTLNFNIPGGENLLYNVTFQPQAANAYNGNLTINSNDEENPVVNVQLVGSGYTHPSISINKTKLEATLAVNAQSNDSFTISNSGSRSLSFSLVAQPAVNWFSATPTSATVAGNGSRNISCSFNATGLAPGTYLSTLQVNSNDPSNALQTLELELTVQNAAPEIDLPAEFEFDMNENLIVDFGPFVSDADGHDLTLTCDGNTEINVDIDGMQVTFSAPLDWYGEEDITFTVDDGYDQNSDSVRVIVHFVNTPPFIDLPDEFEFDMNESLLVDFSPYVSDPDGDELTLSHTGSMFVAVSIDGMQVTFSAPDSWYGAEDITFIVSDGQDQHSDVVRVMVNYVNTPPQISLPAEGFEFMMNGTLTVDFSAFIHDEDGDELILTVGDGQYIQAQIDGLSVTFSAPANWFGQEFLTFTVSDGEDQAEDTVWVRVVLNQLDAPEVNISSVANGIQLSWTEVPNANCYHIYRALEPYDDYGFEPFAVVMAPSLTWVDSQILPRAFYKVVAVFEDLPAKH